MALLTVCELLPVSCYSKEYFVFYDRIYAFLSHTSSRTGYKIKKSQLQKLIIDYIHYRTQTAPTISVVSSSLCAPVRESCNYLWHDERNAHP